MNAKRILSLLLAVIMAFALCACSARKPQEEPAVPEGEAADKDAEASEPIVRVTYINEAGQAMPLTVYGASFSPSTLAYDPAYAACSSAFAASMSSAILLDTEDPDWSGVYSPLSLQIALQLLANGGDERTADMLVEAVCNTMRREDVNTSTAKLLDLLNSYKGVTVNNAVIANSNYRVNEEYANTVGRYYGASIGTVDMSDAKTAEAMINKWISDNTDGLVDDLVHGLSYDTVMLLINTLSFEMEWESPFYTMRGLNDFNGTRGTEQVAMIRSSGEYLYGRFDGGEMAVIPYKDSTCRMAVILPEEGVTPAEAAAALMAKWNECETAQGSITMPKVELDTDLDIMPMLASLGLEDAINGNYSGLLAGDLDPTVSKIYQGAKLIVNEEGTIAAAGTVIEMTKGLPPQDEFTLNCNRPYAMVIYDSATGVVLFVSIVNNV